jgi:putative spermidine/putrescine transport system permease protein
VAAVRTSRGTSAVRWTVLLVLGVFFVLPLVAMLEFSTRGVGGTRDLEAWRAIGDDPALLRAIWNSVRLAVLTALGMLLLLVPTMTWVHLRLPRLRRLVEFLCLLPLLIPAIVLVVGIAPLYSWVTYFLGNSSLTLTFVYVVLVLPYAFRAIEAGLTAMDLHTLSEAARSLGASWTTVLFRIVVPNVRPAVLSASLLSMALVLGEFTLASLLNFETLQVSINLIGRRDAALSIAVSLAALLFAFVLLLLFSVLAGRRRASADDEPAVALAPASATEPSTDTTTRESP